MMTNHSSTLRRLLFLLGGRITPILGLMFFSVLAGLTESLILTAAAQAAAALVAGVARVRISIGPLHEDASVARLLDVALALSLLRLALMAPLSVLPARLAASVQETLRLDLFGAFTAASWTAQAADLEGHLQELMTNQVAAAAQGAIQAAQCVIAGLSLLVLVVTALLLNVVAAILVLGAAVVLSLLLRPLNAVGKRHAGALSHIQMRFASGVGEATRLAEETHVFGVAAGQRDRMAQLVIATRGLVFRTQLLGNLIPNLYRGLIYVLVVAALVVLHLAHSGHIASLGAVVLLLIRAGGYGQALQGSYQFVLQALPYVERVQDATVRYRASAAVTGDRPLRDIRSLAFEDVTFAYSPGRPVLKDLTFAVSGGEAVGVIGPSGAGKSTLVQILLRLRAPDSGCYLVNGVPVDQLAEWDWRARVAYVPQEPRLLHASVADNIRYFRAVDDAAVEEAARLARIHDDVVGWVHGYDTLIGPRADAISGGQQQRICIARALVARPDMLVLDEPSSALDPRSESLLQESLRSLAERVTLVIIAHRLSTLEICNRVMVVVDGRLEAFDTPMNLLKENAYYQFATAVGAGPSGLVTS
jgi:ABC-type multidrug transport system fused ATPase/permease subunit